MLHRMLSPWHTMLRHRRYGAAVVDRLQALPITTVASAHGPVVRGSRIHRWVPDCCGSCRIPAHINPSPSRTCRVGSTRHQPWARSTPRPHERSVPSETSALSEERTTIMHETQTAAATTTTIPIPALCRATITSASRSPISSEASDGTERCSGWCR